MPKRQERLNESGNVIMNAIDVFIYTMRGAVDDSAIFVASSRKGVDALCKIKESTLVDGLNHVRSIHADRLDMAFAMLDESDVLTMTLG